MAAIRAPEQAGHPVRARIESGAENHHLVHLWRVVNDDGVVHLRARRHMAEQSGKHVVVDVADHLSGRAALRHEPVLLVDERGREVVPSSSDVRVEVREVSHETCDFGRGR